MFLLRTLIVSTVLLCKLAVYPVDAQTVRQIVSSPGKNIQYVAWDSSSDVLFYSDVARKNIHRHNIFDLTEQILQLDQTPSFIIPIRDNQYKFLVGLDRDLVVLYWNYSAPNLNGTYSYFTCLLNTVQPLCHGNRWNTGRVDGYGNLWAGTRTNMDPPSCDCSPTLYRASTTKSGLLSLDIAVDSLYASGIEFTADYRLMYTTDFYSRQIFSFIFDLSRGIICCPKIVFSYDDFKLSGAPSSIAKDTDGNLWIGSFGGGQVIQINPNTGELLRTVSIPASLVTSLTFGRPELNALFVGTMRSDNITLLDPLSTSVYVVSGLGVSGVRQEEAVINNFCKPVYFK